MYIDMSKYELEHLFAQGVGICTNSKQEEFFWNIYKMGYWFQHHAKY